MKSSLIEVAIKVRHILITEGKERTLDSPIDAESKRIPFLHTFPKNCCEISSYLFGKIAKELDPKSEVRLVEGKFNGERHYWIVIDGLIYDLTIDQFIEGGKPLLGAEADSTIVLVAGRKDDICSKYEAWDWSNKNHWLGFVRRKLNEEVFI